MRSFSIFLGCLALGCTFLLLPAAENGPDRDQDGLPDSVEDRNGNGRQDPGETDWQNADTDQDGSLDGEEVAARTDPLNPLSYIPKRLAKWNWDGSETDWRLGERGQAPLPGYENGGSRTNGVTGDAVYFSAGGTGALRYAIREANGRLNLRLDSGSIRLWMRPDWTWANRPQSSPRLLEVGVFGDTNLGWWSWVFRQQNGDSPDMWRLELDQGVGPALSSRYWLPLDEAWWTSRSWHELTLSYSPQTTALLHNGVHHSSPMGNVRAYYGYGVDQTNLPPAQAIAGGFTIGSDSRGPFARLEGAIDSLETFNYPLGQVETFTRQQLAFRIATLSNGPPQLELVRALDEVRPEIGAANSYPWPLTLWRRTPGAVGWGEPILQKSVTERWVDAEAVPSVAHEYKVQFDFAGAINSPSLPLCRHFVAGIALPPQHRRGHVIVAVDSTLASSLTDELAQLRTNLVGDGWTVSQIQAPRHDDRNWKANVRNLRKFDEQLAAAVRPAVTNVIFLLGHVVIPYSGTDPSDGHMGQTSGPWACDAYYGYADHKSFTDTESFPASGGGVPNLPDDGRFDQNFLVGTILRPGANVGRSPDFGVGRVDFWGLPGLGKVSEAELIRRYLAKDFRHRANVIPTAGRVSVHLGNPADTAGAHSAQSFAGAAFGTEPGTVFNGWNLLDQIPADLGVHFQYAAGPGGQGVADGRTTVPFLSSNFARPDQEVPITFRQVWFSFACNWAPLDPAGRLEQTDNWLRASLAWPTYGLATLPGMLWDWSPMGGGAPLAALMTHGWEGQVAILRFQSILGDPTLRLHRVTPPANARAAKSGEVITLTWQPSPDPGCTYYIYRSSDGLDGFGEPLGPATEQTTWQDTPPRLPALYQIRAARLQMTGSGSFTNLSQGAFVQAGRK